MDTTYRLVFFGTADCHDVAVPPYHNAVIALQADTGRVRWAFRPDRKGACDFDFGASPNLIDLGFSHYLGIGGKDGTYYLLDRLTFSPPIRTKFELTDAAEREYDETYRQANDPRLDSVRLTVPAGKFAATLRIPDSASGACHVRVVVEGDSDGGVAFGAADVEVARPAR